MHNSRFIDIAANVHWVVQSVMTNQSESVLMLIGGNNGDCHHLINVVISSGENDVYRKWLSSWNTICTRS